MKTLTIVIIWTIFLIICSIDCHAANKEFTQKLNELLWKNQPPNFFIKFTPNEKVKEIDYSIYFNVGEYKANICKSQDPIIKDREKWLKSDGKHFIEFVKSQAFEIEKDLLHKGINPQAYGIPEWWVEHTFDSANKMSQTRKGNHKLSYTPVVVSMTYKPVRSIPEALTWKAKDMKPIYVIYETTGDVDRAKEMWFPMYNTENMQMCIDYKADRISKHSGHLWCLWY